MTNSLNWARNEIEARHAAAQGVWRDGTANAYRMRMHIPATNILDRYLRALRGLEEAVEDAERAASAI